MNVVYGYPFWPFLLIKLEAICPRVYKTRLRPHWMDTILCHYFIQLTQAYLQRIIWHHEVSSFISAFLSAGSVWLVGEWLVLIFTVFSIANDAIELHLACWGRLWDLSWEWEQQYRPCLYFGKFLSGCLCTRHRFWLAKTWLEPSMQSPGQRMCPSRIWASQLFVNCLQIITQRNVTMGATCRHMRRQGRPVM